ncbi:unnamed protein product [Zymoseptoria tritici ST99CH_3D1]|nr:unnamed protein product [Zymoseptoria tritici ST99CH_3D1]
MAYAASPNANAGATTNDELDRLLDMDNAVDDFLNDIGVRAGEQGNTRATEPAARDEDQEVQVKKKRNPVPKLDENRLLSNAGIPRLRKITKTKLKFRGKGYEFSDISNLLNTYQLWLDDLYPRAKFRDALTMVEKVGHSKRMQVTRRAWLDDTKPNRQGLDPDVQMSGANGEDNTDANGQREESPMFGDNVGGGPREGELDALMAESGGNTEPGRDTTRPDRTDGSRDEPDDDELDALLAENDAAAAPPQSAKTRGPFAEDSDDDDLDALMAEQESNTRDKSSVQAIKPPAEEDDDFADDEEAMASMGW